MMEFDGGTPAGIPGAAPPPLERRPRRYRLRLGELGDRLCAANAAVISSMMSDGGGIGSRAPPASFSVHTATVLLRGGGVKEG